MGSRFFHWRLPTAPQKRNVFFIVVHVVTCGYAQVMETNTNHGISYYEQKGVVTYMKPDYTHAIVEGWFSLNGQTVVRRKLRGRNSSAFCSLESVYSFDTTGGN